MDNLETIFLTQIKNLDLDLRKENNDRWSKKGANQGQNCI